MRIHLGSDAEGKCPREVLVPELGRASGTAAGTPRQATWRRRRSRIQRSVGLALLVSALLPATPFSAAAYTAMVAFGDSYTDTGNAPSSPPDYWNGRFSNGPLWIEDLSQTLGFAYNAANNYAVSGTESDELGLAIANFPGTSDSANVLFAIWSGNNDFANHLNLGTDDAAWNTRINNVVSSLMTASDLLYQKGARDLVLFNLMDPTRCPDIMSAYSASFRAYINGKVQIFNSRLAAAIPNLLNSHPGLRVFLLDTYSDFNYLLDNYSALGFTTATIGALNDPNLSDKSFSGPGANYVFWDDQHPTAKGHSMVAQWVQGILPTPPGASPSPPWSWQDIGAVGQPGVSYYNSTNGVFTVTGSGSDIWGTADAFQYVYQTLNGDGVLVARITSQQNTDGFAKAGLMFRETLDPGGRNAMVFVTPTSGAGFQERVDTNGVSSYAAGPTVAAPYWLKLSRQGGALTGYGSPDGTNWTVLGSTSISFPTTAYVGLAVSSHNNSLLNTSMFDNVRLTPSAPTAPPVLNIARSSGGALQLILPGSPGSTYGFEVSSNLVDWTAFSTNVDTSGTIQVQAPQPGPGSRMFYRAYLVPGR